MGKALTAANGLEDESFPLLSLDIETEFSLIEKTVAKLNMDSLATEAAARTGSEKDTQAEHLKALGLERLVTL